MKMLLSVDIPHEPFNTLVRTGTAGQVLSRILETLRPEAAYFTECDGHRGGVFLIDVAKSSDVPRICEPFFLSFNADCKLRIVMSPDDLKSSGLDDIGKKWS